jgi:uncharacterized RDD family membrane protein YckC
LTGEHLNVASVTGTDFQHELAASGSRAYAFLLDWHIRILGVLVWFVGAMFVLGTVGLFGAAGARATAIWLFLPPVAFYFLYHPVLELAMAGNSPGKLMAGVRIVDENGLPPSLGAILIRNIFRIVDGLPGFYLVGLVATMVTRQHVRLGDLVAGTAMIKASTPTKKDLDRVERVHNAAIDAATAELVIELLDRWPTLHNKRRVELGSAVLARQRIQPRKGHRAIRRQLEALLDARQPAQR